jgi:hypothetical protein
MQITQQSTTEPNAFLARKPTEKADNATALKNTHFIEASGLREILGETKWDQVHAMVNSAANGNDPKLTKLLNNSPVKVTFDDGNYFLLVKTAGKIYCLIPSLTGIKPLIGAQVRDLNFELPGPAKFPRVLT